MSIFIRSWKAGSKSAKALRDGVAGKMIKLVGSKYKHNPAKHLVVNWGGSDCPEYDNMLNKAKAIQIASNKLLCSKVFDNYAVSSPLNFYKKEEAQHYLDVNGEGSVIYCRTILNGSQGKGIVVAHKSDEVVNAQLYTVGITGKRREYRAHVFNGKVIHLQQKKRRDGWKENPNYNGDVRNLDGGWVFTMQAVELNEATIASACEAVKVLGLDFGGVDLIVDSEGTGYVIEVNTACGLEGTTVEKYCDAIKKYAGDL